MLYDTDTGYGQPRELMNRKFTVKKHYRVHSRGLCVRFHAFRAEEMLKAIFLLIMLVQHIQIQKK